MTSPRHSTPPLSAALVAAVSQGHGTDISIAALMAAMRTRASALMLVLFALPNILPSLPGTSAITGLPLVILSLQMITGSGVWLPAIIANRAIPRAGFLALLDRAAPYLARVEQHLKPRFLILSTGIAQRLIGALMLALSLAIMLPIPLANALPALAVLVMAMGLSERDGLVIALGLGLALGAGLVISVFYGGLIAMAVLQLAIWF